ncbi:hypothetical protein [Micromonospora pattaloongensis]|uniref:aa3-type cytochrome oxidase subunit CtaJ n=1 Tax=Micromonospora pattaloongensis TaxID=405436 RepID=UPI001FE22510|nr:hypothetical protein [Micromonospora pattaloongensis]
MLYFVGIPVLIVLVIGGLVMLTSRSGHAGGGDKRYRPGRPFDFTPVWFLSSPEQVAQPETLGRKVLPGGVPAPAVRAGGETDAARTRAGVTGGASDRW